MAKFRLAVLNTQPPHLYFGGVEKRILETTKRMQEKADISVYCGSKAGFSSSTNIDGINYVSCHSTDFVYPLDNWTFNRSICKRIYELSADVFEGHAVSGYGVPKKLRQLGSSKPFIHLVHGVLADEYEQAKLDKHQTLRSKVANQFMNYLAGLERQTAKDAALVVTISRYSVEKIQAYYDIDPAKVKVVPNGVDVDKFKPVVDVEGIRRQFGIGSEPCILFVGSLIARKGLPFLVQAAKEVVKVHANAKFIIVGTGPLRSWLDEALLTAGLSGNFRFMGKVQESILASLYGCADVFVLPSIQEGQGIVLLEAQASGKPVVAFDIGGVNEAVCNGKSGLLVEQGSYLGFTDAVLKLLGDRSLGYHMGEAGRRFVLENFTWDLCAERMLRIYGDALAN